MLWYEDVDFFGLLSGVISLVGLVVYAKSTVFGPATPSRATWFIWTLNSVLLLTSYDASGAEATVWLSLAYVLGCFTIAILTIWLGEGGWNWLDRFCLFGAILGVFLWWITSSPLTAFVATLVIDLFGVFPTIKKSWKVPEEEDRLAWIIMSIGGVTSLFAVEEWWPLTTISVAVMAYPIQITVTSGMIVWFLFRRPKQHSQTKQLV